MGQHFTLGAGPVQIMGQHVLPRLYGCRRLCRYCGMQYRPSRLIFATLQKLRLRSKSGHNDSNQLLVIFHVFLFFLFFFPVMLYYSYTLMFSLFYSIDDDARICKARPKQSSLLLCCCVSFCSLLDGVCLSENKRITYLLTYLQCC